MRITRLGKNGTLMERVLHVQIKEKYDLAMTFVRMQEWYESPKFHHKLFTLEEFMRWYSREYGKGAFTYPSDWSGFNVPSTAVMAILNGPPKHRLNFPWESTLLAGELKLFNALESMGWLEPPDPTSTNADWDLWKAPVPFYLVGTHGAADPGDLPHEAAHGRFFVDEGYRKRVLEAIRRHDTSALAAFLLKVGYSKWTLDDEIHAYTLTGLPATFKGPKMKRLTAELQEIEKS